MKFVAKRIHLLSDFFGLLSSKNFSTTAKCRNDFSSLSRRGKAASSPSFARRATKALRRACSQGTPFLA